MAESDVDPSAHTIDELTDEIGSIDDSETLESIYEAESESQDRKGAKEAIESRLEELDSATDSEETNDSIEETQEAIERSLEGIEESGDDEETVGSIVELQKHLREHTPELINRPLDGVIEVDRTDDGWRAIAEFVERRAVPDTQDILGRYEILLDEDGRIHSYRRLDRYRRGDTTPVE